MSTVSEYLSTTVPGNLSTTTITESKTTYTQTTKRRHEERSNGESMMALQITVIALSLILFIGIVLYCRHLITRKRRKQGNSKSNASVLANPNSAKETEVSPYSVSMCVDDEKSFVDSRALSAKSDSSLIKGPDSDPVYRSPCTEEYDVFIVGDNVGMKKYPTVEEGERTLSATQKRRKNREGKPVIQSRKVSEDVDKSRRFTDTFNDQMKPGKRMPAPDILRTYSDLPIIKENSYVDTDAFEIKRFHDPDTFTASHTYGNTDSCASIGVYDDPNYHAENPYDAPDEHSYYNVSELTSGIR